MHHCRLKQASQQPLSPRTPHWSVTLLGLPAVETQIMALKAGMQGIVVPSVNSKFSHLHLQRHSNNHSSNNSNNKNRQGCNLDRQHLKLRNQQLHSYPCSISSKCLRMVVPLGCRRTNNCRVSRALKTYRQVKLHRTITPKMLLVLFNTSNLPLNNNAILQQRRSQAILNFHLSLPSSSIL